MKRQSLHVKDNAIYDQFTKQQVIWTHGYGSYRQICNSQRMGRITPAVTCTFYGALIRFAGPWSAPRALILPAGLDLPYLIHPAGPGFVMCIEPWCFPQAPIRPTGPETW